MTRVPSMPGNSQVRDDDVEGELFEQLDGLFAAVSFDDLEAALAQALGHERPKRLFVVDKEKMQHGANSLTHRPRTGRKARGPQTLDRCFDVNQIQRIVAARRRTMTPSRQPRFDLWIAKLFPS